MLTPPRPPRRRPTPPPPQPGLLAPNVRGWRLHRGLTSVQLAAQAGVGFPTISRGENGHRLKPHTLKKLAKALGVPVEALLVEAPAPPPPPPGSPLVLRTRTRARVTFRAAPRHQAQLDDPDFLAQLSSLALWLLAQQHRADWLGVVARATARDPELLQQAGSGSRPTATVLREAWATWGRWRRHHDHRRPGVDAPT